MGIEKVEIDGVSRHRAGVGRFNQANMIDELDVADVSPDSVYRVME